MSFFAILLLSPLFLILIVSGTIMMRGNPFFLQKRPGKKKKDGTERIFVLVKFRTMSNKKNESGEYLSDQQRLNKYGAFLRSTSLDELPELFNILCGDMSIVGPRPQLVKDMVFMTDQQRQRHSVRPGLTGLAQVSGRNNISWERKLDLDLEYIKDVSFFGDLRVFFLTFSRVIKRTDTVREGTASDTDYGDWLLEKGLITREEYENKQEEAKRFLRR